MPVGDVERDVRRLDRPREHRRVLHVGEHAMLDEELARALRLLEADVAESHVDPTGEQVLLVPFAVAVAQQHERVRHGRQPSGAASARRGRDLA
jgi:hypothetical protein